MRLRPLIMNEGTREKIHELIEYAQANPFKLEHLQSIVAGDIPPAGENPQFRCHLEVGYGVVFTTEDHPAGRARHLSVSVDELGKLPAVLAVKAIMLEFGFKSDLEDCHVHIETLEEGMQAINVIEVIV